jgi:hypothetical protein
VVAGRVEHGERDEVPAVQWGLWQTARPDRADGGPGSAVVLRDGQSCHAGWYRPDRTSPTTFATGAGQPLPLAGGPAWIFLVPVNC